MATTTITLRPDGDRATCDWDATSGIGNHYADINEVITDPTAGDGDCISTAVDDEDDIFNMGTDTVPESYIVTSLKLHVYTKDSGAGFGAYFYTTSTGWSAAKYPNSDADYAWDDVSWTGLELSQADIDSLRLKFSSICIGGTIYIDTAYMVATCTKNEIIISDIAEGTFIQSEHGYAKGTFTLKKDTDVSYDYRISITEDYTSDSATSSTTIFDGIVEDYSLTDIKEINAVSKQDEIAKIQPLGYYQGLTTVRLSKMIEVFGDFISAGYGPTTYTGIFDAPYNFSAQSGKTGDDIDFVDSAYATSPVITASVDDGDGEAGSVHNLVLNGTFSASVLSIIGHNFVVGEKILETIEFWFDDTDVSDGISFIIADEDYNIICHLYIHTDSKVYYYDDTVATKFSDNTLTDSKWYRVKIIWNGDNTWDLYVYKNDLTVLDTGITGIGTYTDDVDPFRFWMRGKTWNSHVVYFDAYAESWDGSYTVGDNASVITYDLPVSTNLTNVELSGGATLQSLLNEGCMTEQCTWSLAPDGDVRWDDGTTASGITLDGTQNVWDISAKYQIKRVNRVVLKGAGGLESIANDATRQTSAGQIIIFKDYRADITNQTDLDTLSAAILAIQKNPPMVVSLSLEWEAKGWIQPSETIHINASAIKYNNSSSYIPVGDYRIINETYHIKDGAYHYIELVLADGLQFNEQLPEDKIDQNTQNSNYTQQGGTVTGGGGGSGISSLVEDTSPQLGGDLDLNGSKIDFPTTANISDCIDDDTMGTASATVISTSESIKAYTDTKVDTTYGAAQHMREIPYFLIPENGETEGDNNVSWNLSNGRVKFGKNSLTTGNALWIDMILPSDYVDGEDITLDMYLRHLGAGEETVDYQLKAYYSRGDDSDLTEGYDSNAQQWTLTADKQEYETLTITGTNFVKNDLFQLKLWIECNDNAFHVMCYGLRIKAPVNARV